MKSYRVQEGASAEARAVLPGHSALMQDLLIGRNIFDIEAAEEFLSPQFERDSHDPMLLPDMEKAVERILFALQKNEPVAVWSDYDCDGIPGGVLLAEFLRTAGLSVRHYIPHRHKEGYGLNRAGLRELREQGITLVITIDLGTTNVDEVAYANELGIDVIVTDHHLVSESLPPAFAVINPKRPDSRYPFDGLCGAGVAWKLVQGILTKHRPVGFGEGQEKWFLDLVGIATLSDMVPLVGENRMLARYGLVVMRKNRRPGLAALLSLLRIKPALLTEDDIGFMIAPRINAASRMDSPQLAASLLASRDGAEAKELARALGALNDERKSLVATTVKEVHKRLATADMVESPMIVMGNPNWRPGILGLVANSLMQAHGKPVFLWGRGDAGEELGESGGLLRGSCRSAGDINVVELMGGASDLFDHFGGHHSSGGFSLVQDRVHELAPRLGAVYADLCTRATAVPEVLIDRQFEIAEVPFAHRELPRLAPFGADNHKPLFLFSGVVVANIKVFGKAKDHLEMSLMQGSARATGIAFFSTPESFQKPIVDGMRADVVGHIETDWRGGPRVRVVDIL